jgi:hypothetical protein
MKNQFNPGTKAGRCPYCGAAIELRSADGIYKDNSAGAMLYVCSGYPDCDAYVRVIPGSKTPVGSMANGVLRALRREAHQYFDRLHLTGMMTRKDAYEWLACILQTPLTRAHIGCLGEYYCQLVIDESKKILANWRRANAGKYVYRMRSAVGR